ncbi:MAG TPA: hypothetical protein VOB72_04360 [Candidatus Dormibacteraeota bacterium]|nr:hypothetical protein [Candidatus Dormibacteraeota bacterium]
MAAAGFTDSPPDLVTLSGGFAAAVSPLARQVEAVVAALGVDTGDPALDARIVALAGQVADSLAAGGMAIQLDADNLSANASTFVAADQAGVPSGPGPVGVR